jgi:hypothetical protein
MHRDVISDDIEHAGTGDPNGVPSDNTTLTEVIGGFAAHGFDAELSAEGDGVVRCRACGEAAPAERWVVSASHRLEGASDPADMLQVIGATCPHCGRGGTLVLGFGPNAGDDDVEVASALFVPPEAASFGWRRT